MSKQRAPKWCGLYRPCKFQQPESDLPQEVIGRFIDELFNSIEDLRNLSLVWPQDLKEIREHYAYYVKRKALRGGWDPDDQNPRPVQLFLSSIPDTLLPCIWGFRLLSSIRVGREPISAKTYFHQWLRFVGDQYVRECYVRRDSLSNGDFYDSQKARWDAVDLPLGHCTGIHALPFSNLQYGFRLEQYSQTSNADGLLDLLAQNAPKLRPLSLGGFLRQFNPHLYLTQPSGSLPFLSQDPAI
ncbi:hypothetical protein F5050DRAFT_1715004 [Lentinula boryana]|uniref:Uncharacterized protein n=1 Tax=Lentinula boryana TaxID=40481 RepID=A0ABQ8Q332_9AGAR|nr:hypothetical protein F5050DRAFT_1715004 [Lentinula boryana]